MHPHRIIFFILSSFLFSCNYQLEESTDPTVELKPDQSTATISITGYPDDTIYISEATLFHYKIENLGDAKGVQGNIIYDDNYIGSIEALEGAFSIRDGLLFNGTHTLKIIFVGSSGSGSLGEELGYESKMGTRTWTVVVNVTPI